MSQQMEFSEATMKGQAFLLVDMKVFLITMTILPVLKDRNSLDNF